MGARCMGAKKMEFLILHVDVIYEYTYAVDVHVIAIVSECRMHEKFRSDEKPLIIKILIVFKICCSEYI